jgi:propanol-preferring alcohol dehydrogenase
VSADLGVNTVAAGDPVGIGWLVSACDICDQCKDGQGHLCRETRFTFWECDGGYSTHVNARADFTFRIPEQFTNLEVAPLLCGGVIITEP